MPYGVRTGKYNELGLRFCVRCEFYFAPSMFYTNKASSDGLQSWCKICNTYNQFKVDIDFILDLFIRQYKGCALCFRADKRLSVDHDHACCPPHSGCEKCIRGLICQNCNVWLGKYEVSDFETRVNRYLNR